MEAAPPSHVSGFSQVISSFLTSPPLPLPLSLHTPSVGICEVSCWGAGVCGEGDLGVLVATLELPKLVFTPLQASGIQVEQHSLALSHQAWPLFGTPSFAQTEDVKGQS